MKVERTLRPVLVAALLFVAAVGCQKGKGTTVDGAHGAADARHYTVRGEVVRLPDPARSRDELYVRHEPIDDFVDQNGRVVGMASMVMPFRVESVALGRGLAVGDKVEIRFVVDWAQPSFRLDEVRRLPPTTPLRFGPARIGSQRPAR